MNTCALCNVIIDPKKQNEVIEDGKRMHEICHRLMNKLEVPCKVCKLSMGGNNGIVRNVEGEGLCKFHVVCYRCVECGGFVNLKIMQDGERVLPFCEDCSRCYNCRNGDYFKCEITIKDDHQRRFIILCGACVGIEDDPNIEDAFYG